MKGRGVELHLYIIFLIKNKLLFTQLFKQLFATTLRTNENKEQYDNPPTNDSKPIKMRYSANDFEQVKTK